MNESVLFLMLNQTCDRAISWVGDKLTKAGLKVMRTFDLKDARSAHYECICPHHGTELCDCQMVVLLVYGGNHPPISLIAHSHGEQTWFYVVDTPQQRADPRLELAIRQTLIPPATDLFSEEVSHSA